MAAPRGNQFWKIRSSHGRKKLFASADLLWQAAQEYFDYIDKHPWKKNEAIKSGENAGKIIKVPTARPYTLSGFCLYLGASENFWREFRKNKKLSKDFLEVITRIEEIIRIQKFEGAAVGAFNANIIASDLGLKNKVDVTTGGDKLTPAPKNDPLAITDGKLIISVVNHSNTEVIPATIQNADMP